MRLAAHEFIRRFLLHVLPDGFHRIRHCGFLAKGDRGQNLERVRALLAVRPTCDPIDAPEPTTPGGAPDCQRDSSAASACPDCGGLMRRLGRVSPVQMDPFRCDTS